MRSAESWADEIAGDLIARLPVNKAYGCAPPRRDEIAALIFPYCEGIIVLEQKAELLRQRIADLAERDWQAGALVSGPFPKGRFQRRFNPAEWETRLIRKDKGNGSLS